MQTPVKLMGSSLALLCLHMHEPVTQVNFFVCQVILQINPIGPGSDGDLLLIVTAQLNLNWSWSETLKWVGSHHHHHPPPGTFKALPGNLGS